MHGTFGAPGRDLSVDRQHPIDLHFPDEFALDALAPCTAESGAQSGIVRQPGHFHAERTGGHRQISAPIDEILRSRYPAPSA
jgi:hypothetical protein